MVTQNRNAQTTMIDPLQIRPDNHTKLTNKKKKREGGRGALEEKEEFETLCLKDLILSVIHLDRCNSRGSQDRGAPSPSEELLKGDVGIIRLPI